MTVPIGREALQRYAAASLDFNPMHLDDAFARQAGEPAVIVHGMLTLSIVVEQVLAAFPQRGRAGVVDVRFGRKLDVDHPVHVWMRVDSWSQQPDAQMAHVTISGEDADGNPYLNGHMDVVFDT